ncbi:MAG TPA: 2'-5' RNA ligase family protein [Nocardioides sp.]|uniref:2'-5' RNA ligase family protein n=1 Tax=Nocardioides sp. TaxID=35761 RepID=UPI002D0D2F6B|nr:2'-5' RNA ligase family protein [Nocardioides sp.]HQR27708.1 2'-5' RNA ligase family protein [Nocardioides sp.]
MALAVCLLLDDRADAAVRGLWRRLEEAGVPSMPSHTHGHHVPHLTYVSLLRYDLATVTDALAALPERPALPLYFDALGSFRRSRCWLAPAVTPGLAPRHEAVVSALLAVGAQLHRNYRPGVWTPHVTLAPRLHLDDLRTVAATVYDVLPLTATATRAALIDTSTGNRYPLPHLL